MNKPAFKPWFDTEENLRRIAEHNTNWTEEQVEATIALAKLQEQHYNLENEMIELALKYEIDLTLGEDKNGQRFLIHRHDLEGKYALDTYKQPGQWMTSYESCN